MDNIFLVLVLAVGAYFLVKHLLGKVYPSDFIKSIRPLIAALIVLLFGLYITFSFSREAERSINRIIEMTTIGNYIEDGDLADIYDIGKSSGAFEDSGLPIPNNLIMWAGAAEIVAFIVIAVVLVLCFIMFRRLFKKNKCGIDAMRIYYVVSGVLMVVSVFISLIASIKIAKFILGSLATKDPSPLSLMWSLSILVVLAVVFIIYNNTLPRLYMPVDQVMGGDNNLLIVPPATPEQVSMQNGSTTENIDNPTPLASVESNTGTSSQPVTSDNISTKTQSEGLSKKTLWAIIGVLGGALLIILAMYLFKSGNDNLDLSSYDQDGNTINEIAEYDNTQSGIEDNSVTIDFNEPEEETYVPSSMAADVLTDILSLGFPELDKVHRYLERNGYSYIAPTINGKYYAKNCDCDIEEEHVTLVGSDEEDVYYKCTPKNVNNQSVFVETDAYRGPDNTSITVWGMDNYNRMLEIIQNHGYEGEAGENGSISFESDGKPSIYLYRDRDYAGEAYTASISADSY